MGINFRFRFWSSGRVASFYQLLCKYLYVVPYADISISRPPFWIYWRIRAITVEGPFMVVIRYKIVCHVWLSNVQVIKYLNFCCSHLKVLFHSWA